MAEKRVCASLIEDSMGGMVSEAKKTAADLVEVRLDHLKEKPNPKSLSKIKKPVIATCMPKWEGGKFSGSEKERVKVLENCLPHVRYVTIELKTNPRLRDALITKAKKAGVGVIVAFHDFKKTPPLPEIKKILALEAAAGADVAKVAFAPNSVGDVLEVILASKEHGLKIPVIALSMGELGAASRIACPLIGSFLTYGAVSAAKKAAAGQPTVDDLKKILSAFK
jgi:3-dehydroquinate dehydratase type I